MTKSFAAIEGSLGTSKFTAANVAACLAVVGKWRLNALSTENVEG